MLEAEVTLARAPGAYFVLDLGDRSVSLKARGMVLRSWEIQKARFWGANVPVKAYQLLKKSAWFPPKRKSIVPGKDAQGNIDLGVLELKEMPSYYSLTFPDGVRMNVRPKTKKFLSYVRNAGTAISRFISLPLKTLWLSIRKKSFAQIDLVLANEKDAKALFWAFAEGQNCIIFRPRR